MSVQYNKYHTSSRNERTLDGIVFDSKAEMNRYSELKILERAGEICDLILQPSFMLQEGFKHANHGWQREITYKSDFMYNDKKANRCIVEDVKGMKTPVYQIKKKLFLKKYPDIIFKEIE